MESALVAPLLVFLILGAIDVGQFLNVAQTVNNASREGARRASRDTVTNASEVKAAVRTYLSNAYPSVSSTQMDSALTVTVRNHSGTTLTGDLTALPTGEKLSVEVSFQFAVVRWTTGFAGVSGQSLKTTTVMRRE